MLDTAPLLVVGEVCVDFTVARPDAASKMRLGGVVHAARGLWASGLEYAVAGVCPRYLVDLAKHYLECHGCAEFVWLGESVGAPNVMVIADATEVADQGYEDLLRDERRVQIFDRSDNLKKYSNIIVFPGKFNLGELRSFFSGAATFSFDIAYDVSEPAELEAYRGHIRSLITSTSSALFVRLASSNVQMLLTALGRLDCESVLLKENRGGSRLFDLRTGAVHEIPAVLDLGCCRFRGHRPKLFELSRTVSD